MANVKSLAWMNGFVEVASLLLWAAGLSEEFLAEVLQWQSVRAQRRNELLSEVLRLKKILKQLELTMAQTGRACVVDS